MLRSGSKPEMHSRLGALEGVGFAGWLAAFLGAVAFLIVWFRTTYVPEGCAGVGPDCPMMHPLFVQILAGYALLAALISLGAVATFLTWWALRNGVPIAAKRLLWAAAAILAVLLIVGSATERIGTCEPGRPFLVDLGPTCDPGTHGLLGPLEQAAFIVTPIAVTLGLLAPSIAGGHAYVQRRRAARPGSEPPP